MPDDSDFAARTLVIVGVGLLGGSVAAAVRKRGLVQRIIGVGRNPDRLQAAQEAGLIDAFVTSCSEIAEPWDLGVIGTPVDRIVDDVRKLTATGSNSSLVTDVGSVKRSICDELADLASDGARFIGSHPLAGSHRSGFEVADADLFDGRTCVVTPLQNADAQAVERIASFWQAIGMRTVQMSPADHDAALATTSHLPHIVAAALAGILTEEQRPLTATGFRDTTRVAAGDPDLWVPILLHNAEAIEASLQTCAQALTAYRDAIHRRDAAELKMLLQLAKTSRDSL